MATRKGSDNRFPLLRLLQEDDTPATSPAGENHLVVGVDKVLRMIDDDGIVTEFGAGGGDVATDAIWNAKGDLAAGTGADTAARLALGANDLALVAASGETTGLKWGRPVGSILAAICYGNSSDTKTTASTSLADADATNLSVAFTAPASGIVLVRLTAVCCPDVGGGAGGQVGDIYSWGIRESSSTIAGPSIIDRISLSPATSNIYQAKSMAWKITGLTPGASHTYKWGHQVSHTRCTGAVITQAATPATMEVIAL